MTETEFTDSILGWLNHRMAPSGVTIEHDTELFASGLVDSLRVLELIAWTERETGRTIPDRMIRMENFRTPGRIAAVFAGS